MVIRLLLSLLEVIILFIFNLFELLLLFSSFRFKLISSWWLLFLIFISILLGDFALILLILYFISFLFSSIFLSMILLSSTLSLTNISLLFISLLNILLFILLNPSTFLNIKWGDFFFFFLIFGLISKLTLLKIYYFWI